MGTTSKKINLGAIGSVQTLAIAAERGRLKSVAFFTGEVAAGSADMFARLTLFRDSGTPGQEVTALASGYCGFLTPLKWDGDIPLQSDMQVVMLGKSFTASTFTLMTVTDADA